MLSTSINLYKQLADHKLFNRSVNFNLKRIKLVLKKLNNPQNKLKNVINIIGSDGKFSLLTSLKYFLENDNQTVSAYISPSLTDIKERFWMGDKYLTHSQIKKTIKIIEKQKVPLTIFEVLTVVFILNASLKKNEFNLIEAGALFAKDSTNVFNFPLIQAIVNINKQHLNFLRKKNLNEVIFQKVGFLSNFTKIYIGKQKKDTLKKIKHHLKKNFSDQIYSNNWKLIKSKKSYFYKDKDVKIKLKNKFIYSEGLLENLCMAIKISLDLGISEKTIRKTVSKIKFPGRIQHLYRGKIKDKINRNEDIILDGAHSQIAAKNLAKYLKTIKRPIYAIWGMTKNKEPYEFIKQFRGIFKKIITVPADNNSNSISNIILFNIAKKNNFNSDICNNFSQALKKITSNEKKTIVVLGSLYLVGSVLNKN